MRAVAAALVIAHDFVMIDHLRVAAGSTDNFVHTSARYVCVFYDVCSSSRRIGFGLCRWCDAVRKLSVSSLQDFTLPITKGSFIFNEMAMRRTNCYCRGSEGLIRYWAGPVLVGWSVSSCVDAGIRMLELSVLIDSLDSPWRTEQKMSTSCARKKIRLTFTTA